MNSNNIVSSIINNNNVLDITKDTPMTIDTTITHTIDSTGNIVARGISRADLLATSEAVKAFTATLPVTNDATTTTTKETPMNTPVDLIAELNAMSTTMEEPMTDASNAWTTQAVSLTDLLTNNKLSHWENGIAIFTREITKSVTVNGIYVMLNPVSDGKPNLSALEGTVFRQRDTVEYGTVVDGELVETDAEGNCPTTEVSESFRYGVLNVNGERIYVKLVEPKVVIVDVVVGDETVPHYAVTVGGFAAKVNLLFRRKENVNVPALTADVAQFCVENIRKHLAKRKSTGAGVFAAPIQMSGLPDNTIGMDVRVAVKLLRKCLQLLRKAGYNINLNMSLPSLAYQLTGTQIRVTRQPDTAPNGCDMMTIQVVDASYPCIGINQKTMESLLGDFDFDTLMLALSLLEMLGLTEQVQLGVSERRAPRGVIAQVFNTLENDMTLQKVGSMAHFDEPGGAFLRSVGTEDKKAIGMFKSSLFWSLGCLFRHVVTQDELMNIANDIQAKRKGDDTVLRLHRGAVRQRLNEWLKTRSANAAAALAFAVWKFEVHGYEEAVMDVLKRNINVTTLKFEPAIKIDIQGFMDGCTKTGFVDWAGLEAHGHMTRCLKIAVSGGFKDVYDARKDQMVNKYRPSEVLADLNPAYHALVSKKAKWADQQDADVIDTLMSMDLATIEAQLLTVDIRTEAGPRRNVETMVPRKGTPAVGDYNPGTIVGGGFESIQALNMKDMPAEYKVMRREVNGFPALVIARPFGPGFHIPFEHGHFMVKNNDAKKTQTKWVYSVIGHYDVKVIKGGNFVIKSDTGASRFCGRYVGCYELPSFRIPNNTLSLDNPELKAYPNKDILHMFQYGFFEKLTMMANNGDNMAMAAHNIKKFITSLVRVSGADGIQFLSEFITLDFPLNIEVQPTDVTPPTTIDLSTNVRRHMLTVLAARGFNLDATSHSTRGREVGIIRPDGTTALTPMLFGRIANPVRWSKGYSTRVSNIGFAQSRLRNPVVTSIITMFCDSDGFGIDEGGNVFRTADAEHVLAAQELPMLTVDKATYEEFIAEYPELEEKCRPIVQPYGDIVVRSYKIPNVDSIVNDGAFKTLVGGFVPCQNQPLYKSNTGGILPVRMAAHFTNNITHVSQAHFVVEMVMDNRTAVKKGMYNGYLSAAASQCATQPKYVDSLAGMVSYDRAVKVLKADKLGEAYPVVGEYTDAVGAIEAQLIAEGKDPSGLMYIYGINDDGSLFPLMVGFTHFRAMVGHVEIMRPNYIAEEGYNNVKESSTQGIHDLLTTAQPMETTVEANEDWAIAQHNREAVARMGA